VSPPSAFAAIGYASLALSLVLRSREEMQRTQPNGLTPRTTPGTVAATGAATMGLGELMNFGRVISAADARANSPVFQHPAKATIYRNVRTVEERLKKIAKLIRDGSLDPEVRKVAIGVVAKRKPDGSWATAEKDWRGEAVAMFNFVRKNVRYTRDHATVDTYVHPARTLFDIIQGSGGGGDCDDMVATLGGLLRAIGHTVVLRVAAIKNPDDPTPGYNHIWLRVGLPSGGAVSGGQQEWIALDASVNQPAGWEAPKDRIYRFKDWKV